MMQNRAPVFSSFSLLVCFLLLLSVPHSLAVKMYGSSAVGINKNRTEMVYQLFFFDTNDGKLSLLPNTQTRASFGGMSTAVDQKNGVLYALGDNVVSYDVKTCKLTTGVRTQLDGMLWFLQGKFYAGWWDVNNRSGMWVGSIDISTGSNTSAVWLSTADLFLGSSTDPAPMAISQNEKSGELYLVFNGRDTEPQYVSIYSLNPKTLSIRLVYYHEVTTNAEFTAAAFSPSTGNFYLVRHTQQAPYYDEVVRTDLSNGHIVVVGNLSAVNPGYSVFCCRDFFAAGQDTFYFWGMPLNSDPTPDNLYLFSFDMRKERFSQSPVKMSFPAQLDLDSPIVEGFNFVQMESNC